MKWIPIGESSDGMYTEIMDLGSTCVMRVFCWDCETDTASQLAITEIDREAGQYAIQRSIEEGKK